MANISIKRGKTVMHIYSAPDNVLDVSVAGLKKAGMQGLLAVREYYKDGNEQEKKIAETINVSDEQSISVG